MVLITSAVFNIFINLINYKASLVHLVICCIENDLFALLARIRAKPFIGKACLIICDNGVCGVEDILVRAIVFGKLKLNNFYALFFVPLLKTQNIFYRSPSKAVNALVIVAYNANIMIAACKKICKHILCIRSVLILVNDNVLKLHLIIFKHIFIFLKQLNGIKNHIVKIHGITSFKFRLILTVALGYL